MKIDEVGKYYEIKNFPYRFFVNSVKREFKNIKIVGLLDIISGGSWWFPWITVKFHKFYVPELLYICNRINASGKLDEVIELLEEETWYKEVKEYLSGSKTIPTRTDFSLIKKEMDVELKPYQRLFIQTYNRKIIYDLRGYLLAFEQGLGKTLTGLALMTSLNKKSVIIICPKSTMISVWRYHIERFYKKEKSIWLPGMPPDKQYDYYICNYESMSKLPRDCMKSTTGVIVDESHNFLSKESNRTKNLIDLAKKIDRGQTQNTDILLMSGTPLKAVGGEMIPILKVLDRKFDDSCAKIFQKTLNFTSVTGSDILANRLGLIMYRKMKSEVLTLPEKHELIRKVKIPNGDKYTSDSVRSIIIQYVNDRYKYYEKNMKKYKKDFDECISWLDKKLKTDPQWRLYLKYIDKLRSNQTKSITRNPELMKIVSWTVNYEKDIILKILPSDLKKKFINSKTVIKYVWMKIQGEVIGNVLGGLRNEMTKNMIEHSHIDEIIKKADKKTLIFTSYVDSVEFARDYLIKKGLKPICVYGETTSDLKAILNKFRNDSEANPLIATIQTLSTGVTLTEANTIIFLNKPWRYNTYLQASDRIHRIGQDSDVYIYTLLLDTPQKNLSNSMEDIMQWSKDMFEHFVGDQAT